MKINNNFFLEIKKESEALRDRGANQTDKPESKGGRRSQANRTNKPISPPVQNQTSKP